MEELTLDTRRKQYLEFLFMWVTPEVIVYPQ